MRKSAKIVALVFLASTLTGCYNAEYEAGVYNWSPDPVNRSWRLGKDSGLEQRRASEVDAEYMSKRLTANFKNLTPSQVAQYAADTSGAKLFQKEDIKDSRKVQIEGGTADRPYLISGSFGPIEQDMLWPVLANAIEMGSPNSVVALTQTGLPWHVGRMATYVQRNGGYDAKVTVVPKAGKTKAASSDSKESE